MHITLFQKKVYEIVKKIPRGRVTTYAAVVRAIRNPHAARAVGNALNKNRFRDVPCHRVIRSDGYVGGYAWGEKKKIEILRREGLRITNCNVESLQILKDL